MGKPREFTTLPARAIADSRLTGLDLRVLAVIAIHDGMSLVKGTGPGCYAKLTTLAELVRTDVSNFSKSVSRLVKWNYVLREPQQMDKRRFTLRVIYGDDDSWRVDQQSTTEKLGEETNDCPDVVGEAANHSAEIVGEAEHENGSISKENGAHYISLNEELHFVETNEINSQEWAHFAQRETRVNGFPSSGNGNSKSKKNGAKAPAIRKSVLERLPKNWNGISLEGKVIRIEEAFDAIGRDAEALDSREREILADALFAISDEFAGKPVGHQANRLWEEIASW